MDAGLESLLCKSIKSSSSNPAVPPLRSSISRQSCRTCLESSPSVSPRKRVIPTSAPWQRAGSDRPSMAKVEVHQQFFAGFDIENPAEVRLGHDLAKMFEGYWVSKIHPAFGRDALYHRPPGTIVTDNALRHVHLVHVDPTREQLGSWRRARTYDRTSDRCFVYSRSCCDRALLLAYVHEEAHEVARDYDYLRALAYAAERWFYRENIYPNLRADL